MHDSILSGLKKGHRLSLVLGMSGVVAVIVLICTVTIFIVIAQSIISHKDDISLSAQRAAEAVKELDGAIRSDMQLIANIWAGYSKSVVSDGHSLTEHVASAVTSSLRRTGLPVYVLDADFKPAMGSVDARRAWSSAAPRSLEKMRARQDLAVAPDVRHLNVSFLPNGPAVQWMQAQANPVNGEKRIHAAARVVGLEGHVLGYLAIELSAGALGRILAEKGVDGRYLLEDRTVQAGQGVMPGTAFKGMPSSVFEEFRRLLNDRYVVSGWSLDPVPWHLIYVLSYGEILGAALPWIAALLAAALLVLAVCWLALQRHSREVYKSILRRFNFLYECERRSRFLLNKAPIGLGMISIDTGRSLLSNNMLNAMSAVKTASGEDIRFELFKKLINQRMATDDAARHPLQTELRFDDDMNDALWLLAGVKQETYKDEQVLVVAITDISVQRSRECALERNKSAADAANMTKSRLLASVSHDIRTMLHPIVGNLEILARSELDQLNKNRISMIRSSCNDLLLTACDVLDLSKIEAGKLCLEHIDFDLNDVITNVLAIFSPAAQEKGLVLAGRLGPHPTRMVRGDPTRLTQLLSNLLSNAVKFTPDGSVVLSVATDGRNGELLIHVADTGIGMSEEQVSRLFRSFEQADCTITRRFGGSGLGLVLCTQLATAMGVRIDVQSRPGGGSCFTLQFPSFEVVQEKSIPTLPVGNIVLIANGVHADVAGVLACWGGAVTVYQCVREIPVEALDDDTPIIFWGGTQSNLFIDAIYGRGGRYWVLEFTNDGPVHPVIEGRRISGSAYSPRSLLSALEHVVKNRPLMPVEAPEMELTRRVRIIVVEDHPISRRLLQEQLLVFGCDVRTASDGKEALGMIDSWQCDMILTDLEMPNMNGYDLVKCIRQNRQSLPIMILTGGCLPRNMHVFSDDPFTSILLKPYTQDGLLQAIGQASTLSSGLDIDDGTTHAPIPMQFPEDLKVAFEHANEQSLRSMLQAWNKGDAAALLAELHAVGGALQVCGMRNLSIQCASLHHEIESGGMANCHASFERFCFDLRFCFEH